MKKAASRKSARFTAAAVFLALVAAFFTAAAASGKLSFFGANRAKVLRSAAPSDFQKRYARYPWLIEGSRLTLPRGSHFIAEDIIIPEGLYFELQAGTELEIKRGKSIVSYSPVLVRGTSEHPVIIRASDPRRPFGTFAVVGPHEAPSRLEHLDFSGGGEARIHGFYFSGALSFHGAGVSIERCRIHDNRAEDGLNVVEGSVRIVESRFYSNASDQIDLDFCRGTISRSEFAALPGGGGRHGGDGLDVKASSILVRACAFTGFKDKGLSMDSDSRGVVAESDLRDNAIGAGVKDGSKALFLRTSFSGNGVSILVRRTQEAFLGGSVYLHENTWPETGERLKLEYGGAFVPTAEGMTAIAALDLEAADPDFEGLFGNPDLWKKAVMDGDGVGDKNA